MLICTAGQAKERPRLIMVPLYSSGSKFGHVSRHSYYRARYYDPTTGRFLTCLTSAEMGVSGERA
jgi:hypothetical protein